MKKLIVILLCLPLFLFSQEEKKYERTMSFSQFAKELKKSANKGIGYTLKNCDIILTEESLIFASSFTIHADDYYAIQDIYFNDTTNVILENCRFSKNSKDDLHAILFNNCNFGSFMSRFNEMLGIGFLECNIRDLGISCNYTQLVENKELDIEYVIRNSKILQLDAADLTKQNNNSVIQIYLESNEIEQINLYDFDRYNITNNHINSLTISSFDYTSKNLSAEEIDINNNVFDIYKQNPKQVKIIYDKKKGKITGVLPRAKNHGLHVYMIKTDRLYLDNNITNNKIIPVDTLLNRLFVKKHKYIQLHEIMPFYLDSTIQDSVFTISSDNSSEIKTYHDSLGIKTKINFFKKYFTDNKIELSIEEDLSEIHFDTKLQFIKANSLSIKQHKAENMYTYFNEVTRLLRIKNLDIDSLHSFSSNTFPSYNRVEIDTTIFKKLGFINGYKKYYGKEEFNSIDTSYISKYNSNIHNLTRQYRQLINILNNQGSELRNYFVMELKNLQTNQAMFKYHLSKTINNWFNYKGSEFLRWYSDYGMNPFKALNYCFWAMLYFAMFYFIFYNEWDKIDRGFLIKRFNSVMDYFTTEKRIEDFYSSTHDKEMTTFTEFKGTLDKNKVYMPSMLVSLAKPIYQISLLRYKILSFSYKKAEFMAGRKWVDLEQKEKYWIGTLTFFLTLTYIIYLVFIRALNSIVLSINAFSTLGFGQIPVRGFTKYVAIIEGFIGWFLLSIFLVSVLSQMMSV
jgi:hypothetical protein